MSTTANDIITDALLMIGAYDSSQVLSDADAQLGLRMLNDLQDSWSNLPLVCYEVQEQSGTLVVGQASYTIGSGGNFNLTRPLKILQGPGAAYVQDANGNNYDMAVVPRDQWNMIANRSSIVTSNFPSVMFYDPQYPLGVINITPFPNTAYTMFWDSYLPLSSFSSLSTALSLPPGYNLALKTNLACLLHPFFQDGQVDPKILAAAASSLANVKRNNYRENLAIYDKEIVSRATSSYNPYTDTAGGIAPGIA